MRISDWSSDVCSSDLGRRPISVLHVKSSGGWTAKPGRHEKGRRGRSIGNEAVRWTGTGAFGAAGRDGGHRDGAVDGAGGGGDRNFGHHTQPAPTPPQVRCDQAGRAGRTAQGPGPTSEERSEGKEGVSTVRTR